MGTTATGRRRNRSWPEALKREIVAASFAPGSSVSMVARHYDVNANQVFSWRRLYRDEPRVSAVASTPQLIPVMVTAEQDAVTTQASTVAETIEIDLAGKYRIRVSSGDDPGSLKCARLACGRTNGHEARYEWAGSAGPGSAAARSPCRRSLCLPRCSWRSDQDHLGWRSRHVALAPQGGG